MRKVSCVFLVFLLVFVVLPFNLNFVPTVKASPDIVTFTVANSVDDAVQFQNNETWITTSAFLEMYSNTSTMRCHGGILFTGVTIPNRVSIVSANLSVFVYSTAYDDVNLKIYGHKITNAPTFGSGENLWVRTKTTAFTSWVQEGTGILWINLTVTGVVQEVVNQAEWQSGNNMSFLFITNSDMYDLTRVRSYDNAAFIPYLTVDFVIGSIGSTILRPNDAGDSTECTAVGATPNWNCTDEETSDGDTTYVCSSSSSSAAKRDLYHIQNLTILTEIYNVTLSLVCRHEYGASGTKPKWSIKTYETIYDVAFSSISSTYVTYDYTWSNNPYTDAPWTVSEVNDLQVGVVLASYYYIIYQKGRCTQAYVTIVYSAPLDSLESEILNVTNFNSDYTQWYTVGGSPWLDGIDYPTNYIWANSTNAVIGNFTFQQTSLSTIRNVWLYIYFVISSTTGSINISFWNGSSWIEAGYLKASTANNWTMKYISLPRLFWSSRYVNQINVRFKTSSSDTYTIDKAYLYVQGWTQLKMLGFLFDTMKLRQINSTFPLVKGYSEQYGTWQNAILDMSPILLYKLTENITYLNFAKQCADWLITQPVCRLFQSFNQSTQQWVDEKIDPMSATRLLSLAMLASINSTYLSLLQTAVNNYTAICFKEPYGRLANAYVDGSGWSESDIVFMDDTAYGATALTHVGSLLNNQTILDIAYRILMNHTRGAVNIPWHAIYLGNGSYHPDYSYSKEDETYGYYLLSLEHYYYQTNNGTIKNLIFDVAYASQYIYNSTNKWFCYLTNPITGATIANYPVHGFGLIDEAMVQAYLIWGNSSWLTWAKNDFITCTVYHATYSEGWLVENDLILHSHEARVGDHDIDDGWNAAAKRTAMIFYNLNVEGFYRNQTWLNTYNKLYGSTSINHKGIYGWGNPIQSHTMAFFKSGYDIGLDTIFRNFQNYTDKTINTFTQLYQVFGNWLSGDTPLPATSLSIGWNSFFAWSVDVGRMLGEICANINGEGISTIVVIKNNGTEYRYDYGYATNAFILILSTSDNITVYCLNSGDWYHSYAVFKWLCITSETLTATAPSSTSKLVRITGSETTLITTEHGIIKAISTTTSQTLQPSIETIPSKTIYTSNIQTAQTIPELAMNKRVYALPFASAMVNMVMSYSKTLLIQTMDTTVSEVLSPSATIFATKYIYANPTQTLQTLIETVSSKLIRTVPSDFTIVDSLTETSKHICTVSFNTATINTLMEYAKTIGFQIIEVSIFDVLYPKAVCYVTYPSIVLEIYVTRPIVYAAIALAVIAIGIAIEEKGQKKRR